MLKKALKKMNHKVCNICKRPLDNPFNEYESDDCGGDCRYCMATVAEDPQEIQNLINFYQAKHIEFGKKFADMFLRKR